MRLGPDEWNLLVDPFPEPTRVEQPLGRRHRRTQESPTCEFHVVEQGPPAGGSFRRRVRRGDLPLTPTGHSVRDLDVAEGTDVASHETLAPPYTTRTHPPVSPVLTPPVSSLTVVQQPRSQVPSTYHSGLLTPIPFVSRVRSHTHSPSRPRSWDVADLWRPTPRTPRHTPPRISPPSLEVNHVCFFPTPE